MNLLTRSLTSNAAASSSATPASRPSHSGHGIGHGLNSKVPSSYAQQQMQFHMNNDSDAGPFPMGGNCRQIPVKKGGIQMPPPPSPGQLAPGHYQQQQTAYADQFAASPTSSAGAPNFDYYEYYSNYGRLLQTPPESPEGNISYVQQHPVTPRLEDMSPEERGPRLGGTRFGQQPNQEQGSRKFWRRSGPPKYDHLPESPDGRGHLNASQLQQTSHHPLEHAGQQQHLQNIELRTPSPPQRRMSTKAGGQPQSSMKVKGRQMTSPPQSPLGTEPPLVSPPYEITPHFPPTGGDRLTGDTCPYRISFIETNVYIPRDVNTSPEHLPHTRFHKHAHGEWVFETVQQLKGHFKPPATQILVNVEKKAKYPFIIFGPLGQGFDTGQIVPSAATNSLSAELRISDGIYDICGSLTRPGSGFNDDELSLPLGYIISAFQTFPGEDSERLENSWITWTGEWSHAWFRKLLANIYNISVAKD